MIRQSLCVSLYVFFLYRGFIFEAVAKVSVLALLHALTLVEAGICGGQRVTQLNTQHIKVVTRTDIMYKLHIILLKKASTEQSAPMKNTQEDRKVALLPECDI